jgi:hypothetical protein
MLSQYTGTVLYIVLQAVLREPEPRGAASICWSRSLEEPAHFDEAGAVMVEIYLVPRTMRLPL